MRALLELMKSTHHLYCMCVCVCVFSSLTAPVLNRKCESESAVEEKRGRKSTSQQVGK